MLEILLPWAERNPKMFIFCCVFWLLMGLMGVSSIVGWPW